MRSMRNKSGALVVAGLVLAMGLAGCRRPPTTPPTTTTTTATPGSTTTTTTGSTPTTTLPGGVKPITVKKRYGPYTIPASTPSRMGMIHNSFAPNIARPCDNCLITSMQAGLETPDGTSANIDQGLWLHHMVMFNGGKQDVTCPGVGVGAIGQRFFSSGNERTPTRTKGPYGYAQGAGGAWTMIYDLMNLRATAEQVYITVTYDYLPAGTPGWREITPVWFDINQCSTSERPAKTGQYTYDYTVTAARDGLLIGIGGHIHDGGTHLTVEQNGRMVCDSVATYGGDPAFIEGPVSIHMPGMAHISSMTTCQGTREAPIATVKAGDQMKITAHYDSNAHMQMGDEPVMGIAVGYVDFG
jgi:hypothetical protein